MRRLAENPLVGPSDVRPTRDDFEVVCAFNPGVARLGEETLLLLRVAERPREREPGTVVAPIWNAESGEIEILTCRTDDPDVDASDPRVFTHRGRTYLTSISHLRLARSTDGVRFTVEDEPALFPESPTEAFGLEDPRITRIGPDYWITHKAVSAHGIATALARTRDFATFERRGVAFCPANLDCVIFPERVGGDYAALTRPIPAYIGEPEIWLARSPDLVHWGRQVPVIGPRPGKWDGGRVGSSCVPFRVNKGWLEIYHGATPEHRYCMGALLLDAEDPSKVLARSEEPLMEPEAPYETEGFFGKVVFPTGCVADGDELTIYYGSADEHTCAVRATVGEIMESLGVR